ncbi:hypothetical protein GCM10009839_67440 [Catenulispora yoronensis]|uniref:Uncharacterized protein n=1 Tax=Catenulispora yoronensis TaxID=450799 RepID=A0ABP5GQN0_9ACTN
MPGFEETTDTNGRAAGDVLLAVAVPAFEAAAVGVCEVFRDLGFASDRIFLSTGPYAATHGILDALCAVPTLDHSGRMWFYCSGMGGGEVGKAGEVGGARVVFRADCPRRIVFLDWHGAIAAALIECLGGDGADLPMTAQDLALRLADVAEVHVPADAAAMLLFPHLLSASDVHRLRAAAVGLAGAGAAGAGPAGPAGAADVGVGADFDAGAGLVAQAATLWRELSLLDPADTDARYLQAHFETVAARLVEP